MYLFARRDLVDAGSVRRNKRPVRKCKRRIVDHPECWARSWKEALHVYLRSVDRAVAQGVDPDETMNHVGRLTDAWCWD